MLLKSSSCCKPKRSRLRDVILHVNLFFRTWLLFSSVHFRSYKVCGTCAECCFSFWMFATFFSWSVQSFFLARFSAFPHVLIDAGLVTTDYEENTAMSSSQNK